jgi:pilus assembly protein CpaB
MNKNIIIVLAGGFLIAVLVALLVQASLGGGDDPAPVVVQKDVKRVQILVAAIDIKAGADIAQENVKWMDWPEDAVFPGAIVREDEETAFEAGAGRLALAVKTDAPIMISSLIGEANKNLAARLEKGMRAFTVSVDSTSMTAGFIQPDDRVDILLTYRQNIRYDGDDPMIEQLIQKNLNSIATETILENIRVLAVDQLIAQQMTEDDKNLPRVGDTVTLEVSPKIAETLAVATTLGRLTLVLRGLGDDQLTMKDDTPVTTDARVTRVYDEIIDAMNKAEFAAGQSARVVRIYRGDGVEDMSVSP